MENFLKTIPKHTPSKRPRNPSLSLDFCVFWGVLLNTKSDLMWIKKRGSEPEYTRKNGLYLEKVTLVLDGFTGFLAATNSVTVERNEFHDALLIFFKIILG